MRTAPNILSIVQSILIWTLVIFFIAGSIGNIFPPDNVRADYER